MNRYALQNLGSYRLTTYAAPTGLTRVFRLLTHSWRCGLHYGRPLRGLVTLQAQQKVKAFRDDRT
jgi:hypothetical protein